MYCQTCGASFPAGLSYCNRCGAELNAKQVELQKTPDTMPESLIWAIVSVAVVGMGIVIALMALMKQLLGVHSVETILLISLLSFIPFAIAETVFIWMLVRLQRKQPDGYLIEGRTHATKELPAANDALLSARPGSVVEQTTRNLEPVLRERRID